MKRIILVALVTVLVSGPAWGVKNNSYSSYFPGSEKCTKFLSDYARAETTATRDGNAVNYSYPAAAALEIGWILGFISGTNREKEGRENFFLYGWVENIGWIASWCRDNPSKDLLDAVEALMR